MRPFKDLNNENVVEPYFTGLYNCFYTKNYFVFLQQGSDDSYIYIEIYKLDTWETVLKRTRLTEYTNKSALGSNVTLSMTYEDDVYLFSREFSSILNITVDESQANKYVFNVITLPRKMTDYVSICTLGNTAYMFGLRTDSGTSSSANTTYTSILKFDASNKAVTVLGISTVDMGFNVGVQSSSTNSQTDAGVYGCFPYRDNEIMIFGKHADADLKTVRKVLYNTATGEYKNVTDDPGFAYLTKLSLLNTLFSSSNNAVRAARNPAYFDGLVLYLSSNSISMPINASSVNNYKWYLDTQNSGIIYLRLYIIVDTKEQKIYSTWLPDLTASTAYVSGSYSSGATGFSYTWQNNGDRLQRIPAGINSTTADIRKALTYDLDRKTVKAFSLDTTDLKLRAAGAFMIDSVVLVKKGTQVKPFSEYPSPMQIRFIRPSNLSIINIDADPEGFYETQEDSYMYMAIESARMNTSSSYPLAGYPYINEYPFKVLVR